MTYQILICCGLGDVITYQARFDSFLSKNDRVKISILGGFPKSVSLQKEVLAADPRVFEVLEGRIGKADITLDWRPDYAPLGDPIQIPFQVPVPKSAIEYANVFFEIEEIDPRRTIIIHPKTTEGNASGFEPVRHWDDWKWQKLIDLLVEQNFSVIQIGSKSDDYNFHNTINLVGRTRILESIALILKAKYCIDVNSFVWEVAAYAEHPTISLWFHNQFWIPLHVPDGLKNLKLFLNREDNPEEVLKGLLAIENG